MLIYLIKIRLSELQIHQIVYIKGYGIIFIMLILIFRSDKDNI